MTTVHVSSLDYEVGSRPIKSVRYGGIILNTLNWSGHSAYFQ